jgi:hypothetical protein
MRSGAFGIVLIGFGLIGSANPAGAISLSQCNSKYWSCRLHCYDLDSPFPPDTFGNTGNPYCFSRCWDNHALCVDRAMSSRRSSSARPGR